MSQLTEEQVICKQHTSKSSSIQNKTDSGLLFSFIATLNWMQTERGIEGPHPLLRK